MQQALTGKEIIDGDQDLIGQLVALKAVGEPQDGALVGHFAIGIELGKLPVDGRVKEGFFHAQVRQGKPLLHAVNSQHGLRGKGWAAVLAFGVVRGHQFNQCSPGNHKFHPGQQFLLAGLLGGQVQVKAALLCFVGCEDAIAC